MFEKLQTIEARYDELMALVSAVSVQSDPNQYRTHSKALSELQPVVDKYRDYRTVLDEIDQAKELDEGSDPDMRELAEQELASLEERRETLVTEIKSLMVPKDPNDEKNVMLEIRAGTGGDEAGAGCEDHGDQNQNNPGEHPHAANDFSHGILISLRAGCRRKP